MSTRRLVVFDTNVVEGRYLPALLRGEAIRDLQPLRDGGFHAAVVWKSLLEIQGHAKRGTPRLPWMTAEFGYPGGLDVAQHILNAVPELASRANLYYWFGLSEEWYTSNWEAERGEIEEWVRGDQQEAAIGRLAVRRRFAGWKQALQGFCQTIRRAVEREFQVLYSPFVADPNAYFALVQQLSDESLIPNEDLEIVVGAIFEDAVAFVTDEEAILHDTALSLGLGHGIAFVHPDQLKGAAEQQFETRWSREQTRRGRRA